MFGRSLKLFRVLGFDVRVDISWTFFALLIATSLALGFFPAVYEGWPASTYWWMAVGGVIGVFFSIVIHELSHSVVSRAFGTGMTGITLFLFGGVAEMKGEPESAKAEFFTAIAGPAISIVLGVIFLWLASFGGEAPTPASALAGYLGRLNLVLAIFNLIPAFPMDGGRVLRAILWAMKGDLRWATKWASGLGGLFGFALMMAGLWAAFSGSLVAGLWWFLIGMFIRGAAQSSYQQMEVRRLMGGVTVRDLMHKDAHVVPPTLTLAELVDRYVYEFQQTAFPVSEHGDFVGVVDTAHVKSTPREEWSRVTVKDIMTPPEQAPLAAPAQDAIIALQSLQQTGADTLIVTDGRGVLGTLSRGDVMKLLGLKMDLESV
ncbi:M50 family metallopeptidase [Hyphococcus sp.]|uniref:M50 family metallopeptidase n=1 Tax=Hyphococcus sp. TaxID=2038636 RepID=UPI0035C75469